MTKAGANKNGLRGVLARVGLGSWRGRLAWMGGLLLLTVFVCWLLARTTPSWYVPMDADDQSVIDASGRGQALLTFEIWNAIDGVPLGDRQWSVSQDELNSFIATNMAGTLDVNGRRQAVDAAKNPVFGPMVIFGKGEVTVAARFNKLPSRDPRGGVGWATFSVGMVTGSDGMPMGTVKLKRLFVGYLPVPQFLLQSRMQAMMPEMQEIVKHVLQTQMGAKDIQNTGPIVDEMLQNISQGKPFPLHFSNVRKRDFVVSTLDFEPGRFTLVLSPTKPAIVRPRDVP